MHETIEQYIEYIRDIRRLAPKSVKAYTADLCHFSTFCSDSNLDPAAVDYRTARRYVASLVEAEYSTTTINRMLSAVKGYYGFLVQHQLTGTSPFSRIRSMRGGRNLPTVLTVDEIHAILASPGEDFTGLRDRVIFEVLYSTGCRLSELLGISINELNLTERVIKIRGKGGKDRFLFLTASAAESIGDYLPLRNLRVEQRTPGKETDRLLINRNGFPLTPQGVHYIFRQYTRKLGLQKHITPHTIRHSFATHILDNNAGIRVVQELLGHERISTTQIYAHVSAKRLKEVYDNSHPHG